MPPSLTWWAAGALVAAGIATALPTALTGLADWSGLGRRARRVGLVHAAANNLGLALYVASLIARRRGWRARGTLLGLLGATAMTAGGYLGGHLAYRLGAGVNRNAFEAPPDDWTPVAELTALPPAEPVAVAGGSIEVLLVRDGERVRGPWLTDAATWGVLCTRDTIVCPWHGSAFRLGDGAVVHGPASAPQPALEVPDRRGKS